MNQPTGQALHIPIVPINPDRITASTTRKIRSVKVDAINSFIRLAPRKTPSVTSYTETTR